MKQKMKEIGLCGKKRFSLEKKNSCNKNNIFDCKWFNASNKMLTNINKAQSKMDKKKS